MHRGASDPRPATDGLHAAAAADDVEGVRRRLSAGAPIDRRDAEGCTPLHAAVEAGALEVAGLLVNVGADLHARCRREDLTPLHLAALSWRRRPDGAVIDLLRGYDADPAAPDANGLTAATVGTRFAGLPDALAARLDRPAES